MTDDNTLWISHNIGLFAKASCWPIGKIYPVDNGDGDVEFRAFAGEQVRQHLPFAYCKEINAKEKALTKQDVWLTDLEK